MAKPLSTLTLNGSGSQQRNFPDRAPLFAGFVEAVTGPEQSTAPSFGGLPMVVKKPAAIE